MTNSIASKSYSVSSSTSSSDIPLSSGDKLKNLQRMRLEQMIVQTMNLESTLIDNKGEVAGKRLESENALKNQNDNEQEYKKQQRHKIIHSIVSFFTHVISIVMIVVRPVKSIAKMATKGIKKAVSKTVGKSVRKTAGHMMEHIGISMKHVGHKGTRLVESGKKAMHHKHGLSGFMKSDVGRLVKREALINGSAAALNGVGDGVTKIQISEIENRVETRDNQNELIEADAGITEELKKQQIDNMKQIYQEKEDNIKLVNSLIKHVNDISSAFINQAA